MRSNTKSLFNRYKIRNDDVCVLQCLRLHERLRNCSTSHCSQSHGRWEVEVQMSAALGNSLFAGDMPLAGCCENVIVRVELVLFLVISQVERLQRQYFVLFVFVLLFVVRNVHSFVRRVHFAYEQQTLVMGAADVERLS